MGTVIGIRGIGREAEFSRDLKDQFHLHPAAKRRGLRRQTPSGDVLRFVDVHVINVDGHIDEVYVGAANGGIMGGLPWPSDESRTRP